MELEELRKSGVTRRSLVQLAAGMVATIPGMMVSPLTALAKDENGWAKTVEQDAGSAGTSILKVVKLKANEVGIQVIDVSTKAETMVQGARVKIISSENDKAVEGVTDEHGMLVFDITELARCSKEADRTKLSDYRFYGSISVDPSGDGFRKFASGLWRFVGGVSHVIPTRRREDQMYPLRATFDEWDVLYTSNSFVAAEGNDATHRIEVEVRGLGNAGATLALRVQGERRPRQSVTAKTENGAATVTFAGKFLHTKSKELLPVGCAVTIDVTQGGTTKSVNLHLVVEKSVINSLEEGTQATLKPFDFSNIGSKVGFSLDSVVPSNIPIIGGGKFGTIWMPTFYMINMYINPFGYFQLTAQLGSKDGSGLPASYGYKNLGDPANKGWKSWPRASTSESWNKYTEQTQAAYSGVQCLYYSPGLEGLFGHGAVFPNVELTGGFQAVAAAAYDWEKGIFQGSLGGQFLLNFKASVAEQFVAFGIPLIFTIGVESYVSVFLGCGMYSKKTRTGSIDDWAKALLDFGNWHFDYTNTGLTITFSLSMFMSLGVGIRNVVSVSVMGKGTITLYIGLTYRGKLDPDTHPLPQVTVGFSAELSVVIQILFVTKTCPLLEQKYVEWYNRWKSLEPSAQADDDIARNIFADKPFAELVDSMNVVTDAMLLTTSEAEGETEASAQTEGSKEPFDWESVREDDVVGVMDDGTEITYAVYNIADVESRLAGLAASADAQTVDDSAAQGAWAIEGQVADDAAIEGVDATAPPVRRRRGIHHTRSVRYRLTRSAGLSALADGDVPEPRIVGLGREGGVRPSSDVILADNIFGDPRIKVVNIPIDNGKGDVGYLTCCFRVASVTIDGVSRARVFMEIINVVNYDLGDFETRQMIDFDITTIEGVSHNDLYDYDFDVTWTSTKVPRELGGGEGDYWRYVHFVIVSGRRAQGDDTPVRDIAHDLVFTYLSVSVNDLLMYYKEGRGSFAQYSVPAKDVMQTDTNYLYHSIFGVSCQRVPEEDSKYILISYLDRVSNKYGGVTSIQDGDVHVEAGFLVVDVSTGTINISKKSQLDAKMSVETDVPDIYELKLLPKIDGYYGLAMRGFWTTYYYALSIDEETGTFTSIDYAGGLDAWMQPWPRMDCFLAQESTDTETGNAHRRESGELKQFWWVKDEAGKVVGLEGKSVGPDDFGVRKFGINANGSFIFWPQGREGDDGRVYGMEGEDGERPFEAAEDVPCYQIMAMRVREYGGQRIFSDPFVVAEVEHRMRDLVVVATQETRAPLEVLSIDLVEPEEVDTEGQPIYHSCNLWYTAVPNLKCAAVLTCAPITTGVFAGGMGSFRVAVKNFGNCYLRGCTVQMCLHGRTDEAGNVVSEEFSKVEGSTFDLDFCEETLLGSSWNPEDEHGVLQNVEPDYSLAPGKVSEYRVEVPIPLDWESGDYTISFWAYSPVLADDGGLNSLADDEAEYQEFTVEPSVGTNYVKRTSLDIDQYSIDTTVLEVSEAPDGTNLNDAPVQSREDADANAATGGSGTGGPATDGGTSTPGMAATNNATATNATATNATTPNATTNAATTNASRAVAPATGDHASGLLAAGLAAAGAAALAYQRRRVRNEKEAE